MLHRERELAAWKAAPAAPLVPVPREPDDPAFWVMTSGTTGVPKAVEHHHRNVGMCAEYYEQVLGCTRDDRMFATSRFHFAYAIGNMFAALRMGAGNILLERWATAQSVAETVERFKPTVLLSVPAVYHRLLEAGLRETAPFRALRHYVSAGERMPPQIWNAWEAAGGHPILDGLGCSECVYMIIGNTPARRRPGSSGDAMPSVELRIVDEARRADRRAGHARAARGADAVDLRRLSLGRRRRSTSRRSGRPSSSGRTAGSPPATSMSATPTASIITAAAPATCCGCRASGFRRPRSRTRSRAGRGSPRARRCWAKARSASPRSCSMSCRRPAPTMDAAMDAARERLAQALPRYKQPRRFEVVADLPRTATGKMQRHKLRELLRARFSAFDA